jgi:hypothetical protein
MDQREYDSFQDVGSEVKLSTKSSISEGKAFLFCNRMNQTPHKGKFQRIGILYKILWISFESKRPEIACKLDHQKNSCSF